MSEGEAARRYLRHHHVAALATVSARLPAYPFGSIVPFVLDAACRPLILISALAEHTKNLTADPRASLVVHDAAADVQAGARLTVVADAVRVAADDPACARYMRYFPTARELLALGDFSFWALAPRALLFIRGFGRISWIEAADVQPPPDRLAAAEEDIIAHMNADHADALLAYCRHVHQLTPQAATMLGIDRDGLDVRADGAIVRFEFDQPVTNAGAARQALVALARAARGP